MPMNYDSFILQITKHSSLPFGPLVTDDVSDTHIFHLCLEN